ncbi:MAG: VacJ family lipoprotein [Gammaproteobacteria bacterium]|jgi:phospholipid-binding lipoprotein MlaA
MVKTTSLILALLIPASGFSGENVLLAYAGDTNLTTSRDDNGPLRLAGSGITGMTSVNSEDDEDLPFMDDDEEVLDVYDPLEGFNRGMFWFNDKLYFYLAKPIARGMRVVIPEPLLLGFRNFMSNLKSTTYIVNALLQGKFGDAGNELTRFAVNSTLGIGGLFDPAKVHFGIRRKTEDTGQTMGHYGIGPGPYLVLPVIGPSNFRDGIGLFGDYYTSLVRIVFKDRDYWIAKSVEYLDILALDKDTYEGIKRDALDPYLFVRDAYMQRRRSLIEQ